MKEELDKEQVRKDLEMISKKLHDAHTAMAEIQVRINEIYKST